MTVSTSRRIGCRLSSRRAPMRPRWSGRTAACRRGWGACRRSHRRHRRPRTHAVAFVVLHFSVLVASDAIELGVADREIVGADTAGPVNVMSSTDNVRHALVGVSVIGSVWLPAGVEPEALKLCHELLDTFALRSDFPSRLTCTAGQPD